MSRKFRTNNHPFWYIRILQNVYSDALFSTTISRRGNRCTQIFAINFGWSCLFPMKLKSKAHEALSLFFQGDRVLPAIIYDSAKEMILGNFKRKLKETYVT